MKKQKGRNGDEELKIYKNFLRHIDVKLRFQKLEAEEKIFKQNLTNEQKKDFEKIILGHLIVQNINSIELIETTLRYKNKRK